MCIAIGEASINEMADVRMYSLQGVTVRNRFQPVSGKKTLIKNEPVNRELYDVDAVCDSLLISILY